MTERFDGFVLFAEMRTGSNHLEESLNELPDVTCHGEVFNPVFIGRKDQFELLGYDMARRERDPYGFLERLVRGVEGLSGFRYFHDHDPRVLETVIADPRIAKVLLTRNPLDSYVSRKIASATGQWRLTDLKHARTTRIAFDEAEFAGMLEDWAGFRDRLRRMLQTHGQTAFHIRYEDINDVEVLNGLAAFLGSAHRLPEASRLLKRQNPGDIGEKVENLPEMEAALARIDRFGLGRVIDGEVPRAPGVPGFVAHPEAGLLFLPVAGAPEAEVIDWMAGIGGVGREGLVRDMTQKDLRHWMRANPGFTSFTVLRHPVARANAAWSGLLEPADGRMAGLRDLMARRYGLNFAPDAQSFRAFLAFLKGALAGQVNLKTEAAWATQMSVLQAASQVVPPQRILREETAGEELARLVSAAGPILGPSSDEVSLLQDAEVEKAVFDVYRRDYIHFGFGPWPERQALRRPASRSRR
jgi:hypothetical protein